MKINAKVTISRVSGRDVGDFIRLSIQDDTSGQHFVEAKMSLSDFARCITGFAFIDCPAQVRNLDLVGKKMEHKPFEFKMPDTNGHSRDKKIAADHVMTICPEGWEPDTSFSSQGSFFNKDGEVWARCTIRRWV